MIVYKKTTKDEPINNQIRLYEKVAEKWKRYIKNYLTRQTDGSLDADMAAKQINFCTIKLQEVEAQLAHLRKFAEV